MVGTKVHGKEDACNAGDRGLIPGKIPCRREWLPTPVFLVGEFHGQRSLEGYSPWGRKLPLAAVPRFQPEGTTGILSSESPVEEATHLPRPSSVGPGRTRSPSGSGSHRPGGHVCRHPPGGRPSSCSQEGTGPHPPGLLATGTLRGTSPGGTSGQTRGSLHQGQGHRH